MMYLTLAQIFINSFFFPFIMMVLMRQLGFIKDFNLETREERIIPFIGTLMVYIWTMMVFRKGDNHEIFGHIMLGAVLAMSLAFLLTILSNKVSLHAMGTGIFLGLVLRTIQIAHIDVVPIIFAVILITGLVASSRLLLKAHVPREVYFGFLIGLICLNLGFLI